MRSNLRLRCWPMLAALILMALTAIPLATPAHAAEQWCRDPTTGQRTIAPGQVITLSNGHLLVCHEGELETYIPGVNDFRELRNLSAGMCMTVSGGSRADGAAIIQWPCAGNDHSQWWALLGNNAGCGIPKNYNSGMCAGISGSSTANGGKLIQMPCGTGADRLWQKTRDGAAWRFINDRSGKLVSVPGSSTTRGLQLHQWVDEGHGDQRWTILPLV